MLLEDLFKAVVNAIETTNLQPLKAMADEIETTVALLLAGAISSALQVNYPIPFLKILACLESEASQDETLSAHDVDRLFHTLLNEAVTCGHADLIEQLLARCEGATLDCTLWESTQRCRWDVVDMLLKHLCDDNLSNKRIPWRVLQEAVIADQPKTVQGLLCLGESHPSLLSKNEILATLVSLDGENETPAKAMLRKYCIHNCSDFNQVYDYVNAVRKRDMTLVKTTASLLRRQLRQSNQACPDQSYSGLMQDKFLKVMSEYSETKDETLGEIARYHRDELFTREDTEKLLKDLANYGPSYALKFLCQGTSDSAPTLSTLEALLPSPRRLQPSYLNFLSDGGSSLTETNRILTEKIDTLHHNQLDVPAGILDSQVVASPVVPAYNQSDQNARFIVPSAGGGAVAAVAEEPDVAITTTIRVVEQAGGIRAGRP